MSNDRDDAASPPDRVDGRLAPRSNLTRWLAQRDRKLQPDRTAPTYERCHEKDCWGKASWTCPRCQYRGCGAHRVEHHCSLPYLPA